MHINKAMLQKICRPKQDKRECLIRPFIMGDSTYASDARRIVRINRRIENVQRRDCSEFFSSLDWPIFQYLSNGVVVTEEDVKPKALPHFCRYCAPVSTKKTVICPECHGEGYFNYKSRFNDYESCCYTCSGRGKFVSGLDATADCLVCKSTRWRTDLYWKFRGKEAPVDVRLLAQLVFIFGPIEFFPSTPAAIPFRFEDGEGFLMTMKLSSPPEPWQFVNLPGTRDYPEPDYCAPVHTDRRTDATVIRFDQKEE